MTSKLLTPFFGFFSGEDLKSMRLKIKRLTEPSGREQMSVPMVMEVKMIFTFHGRRRAERASDISAPASVPELVETMRIRVKKR